MPLLRNFLLVVAITVIGTLIITTTAAAQATGGIGGRPANPDINNPRSQSIFIFTANLGETKSDAVLVSNNTGQTQTIQLYAVDGVVTNTGAYTCAQESEARQDAGAWVVLSKETVTLDTGKTEEVPFNLTVPANADVGEHNACLVFQLKGDEGEASGNVRIRTRQAIRLVATVPGNLSRSVAIESFELSNQKGNQVFSLKLQNKGNVSADVDAQVLLKSFFGDVIYENGGGYPVLANQKLDLSFVNEATSLFGGWYYASAKISYDNRAGTFGTSDSSFLEVKETDRQLIYVAPTAIGAVIILSVVGIITAAVAWLLVRRRERINVFEHGHKYTVVSGDSLQSIADHYQVQWKKLASVNKISAPYTLKDGTIIRVPTKSKKNNLSKRQNKQ